MDDQPDTVKRPRSASAAVPTAAVSPGQAQRTWRAWLLRGRALVERSPRLTATFAALLIYLAISMAYFWWPIHSHFGDMAVSSSSTTTFPDLGQSLWYLRWWPYALTHGLNPFITFEQFHAHGYNVTWEISTPAIALLAWPVTAAAGPIAAFNLTLILSFALTAWATFILCYHLTRQVWPALVGGYLFGFSGFMVAQATGHIHLIVLFPIPIALYLAVLRYEGRISRARFLLLAPLPLLFQFLVSVEEFALVAVFVYIALGVWLLFNLDAWRTALRLAIETTVAYFIAAAVLTPYLFYMATGYVPGTSHTVLFYTGDLLGFVLPTKAFWLLAKYFSSVPMSGGNLTERDSYLGFPLALLMIAFAMTRWRKPAGRFLTVMALISLAFAFGPSLFVAGVQTMPDPIMRLLYTLPLIQKSLPIRYALFLELVSAVMAALWLAQNVKGRVANAALGLALVVTLIPSLTPGIFFTPVDVPPFFRTTLYQRYITPGDNLLILPLGDFRVDLLWQQETNFYFTLAQGYGAVTPRPENILPIIPLFSTRTIAPEIKQPADAATANAYQYYMEQYIATEHITGIVVREGYNTQCAPYLLFLHETPIHTGSAWYYPVPTALSHATPPAERVAGEAIARSYRIDGAARWNEASQQIVVLAKTPGAAVETWADSFSGGTYAATFTIHTASSAPAAYAEIAVNGQIVTIPLADGVTRASLSVPGQSGTVVIRIISLGATAFTIGDMTLTRR